MSHGVRIGVRTNEPGLLDRVLPRLPASWRPATRPVVDRLLSLRVAPPATRRGLRPFHQLYADTQRLARSFDLDELLHALELDLEIFVASAARHRVFVHAGVVGWRGRAIVVPGDSQCGKSTLVAALLRAGATYYSDEYALLDRAGRVHPYPRPLRLRDDVAPRARGGAPEARPGRRPLEVGLVVFARYERGARWRPRGLSPGRALLALVRHTVPVRLRPESALGVLGAVVAGARVLSGKRGEATEVASDILARLGGPAAQ